MAPFPFACRLPANLLQLASLAPSRLRLLPNHTTTLTRPTCPPPLHAPRDPRAPTPGGPFRPVHGIRVWQPVEKTYTMLQSRLEGAPDEADEAKTWADLVAQVKGKFGAELIEKLQGA